MFSVKELYFLKQYFKTYQKKKDKNTHTQTQNLHY